MIDAGAQATLDQLGALVRDTFAGLGVNLQNPDELRAVRITTLLISTQYQDPLLLLGAIANAAK